MIRAEKLEHETILGPEQYQYTPGYSGRRIGSPDQYLGWHTAIISTRGGVPWDTDRAIEATINHGRWIAECIWCKDGGQTVGMLTRPEWGVAYCAECGARYGREAITFPANYKEIEKPLRARVMRTQQNWDRRQTVKDLEEENKLPEVITFLKIRRVAVRPRLEGIEQ